MGAMSLIAILNNGMVSQQPKTAALDAVLSGLLTVTALAVATYSKGMAMCQLRQVGCQ